MNNLIAEAERFIGEKGLPENITCLMQKLSAADQSDLLGFLSKYQLSHSHARELTELFIENALMKKISVKKLISDVNNVLVALDELTGKNKAQQLKTVLMRMRYPQISAYQEQMADSVRQIRLPAGAKFQYPQDLEDGDFRLELVFNNEAKLKKQLAALNDILEEGSFRKVFQIVEGQYDL